MNTSSKLSRRKWLKTVATAATGIAALPFLASTAQAAPAKLTKAMAHYQDQPHDGKMCARCKHFIPAGGKAGHGMMGGAMGPGMMHAGLCQVVQGPVSPRGYCLLYLPL
ncbi:hypothetical protein [Acidiferrobacter thiooxydans]|jgi:anaerobic selenocysteine-containing dehydrogenase|uniref:Uncharacterized protein n=1 Tax=Acidiferrobacter thiooxydans TaxID=163359 RepID=A0A1C2G0M8_9GAMM|nr:hypothetical protein [Acidiferrobacter thiooxydans]MDA8120778.1 hypothetical protein [Gammaproteobacteria bacterium]RCN56842.1 hypothetical protein C4900_13910 [Acidiferrobacter thiooxydans]UEN99525.1 hypothetical protein A9R16_014040 [Acidiferrobacter thiooxydans]